MARLLRKEKKSLNKDSNPSNQVNNSNLKNQTISINDKNVIQVKKNTSDSNINIDAKVATNNEKNVAQVNQNTNDSNTNIDKKVASNYDINVVQVKQNINDPNEVFESLKDMFS